MKRRRIGMLDHLEQSADQFRATLVLMMSGKV